MRRSSGPQLAFTPVNQEGRDGYFYVRATSNDSSLSYPIGDRSVSEVVAGAPAESITSNVPVSLGTRCAFSFDGEPPFVEAEYTLDADHFRTKKGLLRFEIEEPLVSSKNNFTSYPNTHIRRG